MLQQKAASYFDVPVLRYVGAKWKIADWLIGMFPEHESYVEPFSGSAAIYLRKPRASISVLNDLSEDVVNFYRVLREQPNALIHAIELTPFSRREYDLSYAPADEPLEKARRFYVRCWQAFGSSGGRKTGWRWQRNTHRGTSTTREWSRTEGLWYAAEAFKDAQIECRPAIEIIKDYDTPRAFFYVDPPYVYSARSDGGRLRYTHEMNDNDHRDLANVLQQIKGTAIVSGYDCQLYDELFAGWHKCHKTTTTNGNNTATETVWLHPRLSDYRSLPLFASIGD